MVASQYARIDRAPVRQGIFGSPVGVPDQARHKPQPNSASIDALALVAHDLRGPLSSLSCLLELVDTHAKRNDKERIADCTKRATDILSSLDGMLNSVLERVKASGDPLCVRPEMIDINHILKRAVSLNLPAAEAKSVSISIDGSIPLNAWGDGQLLLQAVENLVGNAVKHSVAGNTIACGVNCHDRQIVIQVTNQANGVNELDIRRAFRPFTKLSAKALADGRSWGLGLWFVRLIAERHGGRIECNACDAGENTVFSLILPA